MSATKTRAKTKITLRPAGDRVLIQRDEAAEMSPGGIDLTGGGQSKPNRGTVLAVGPGRRMAGGAWQETITKVGDRVIFGGYAQTVELGDEEYVLVDESEIQAYLT